MNITREQTDNLRAEIKVLLQPEDYKPQVVEELKRQAKKANIPGFRQGKVPLSIIKKMVGLSVLMDQLGRTLNQSLNEYIQSEELRILGEPLPRDQKNPEEYDLSFDQDLEFKYEVGLAPEVELDMNLDEVPPVYEVEIDQEYVDSELEKYKDRLAEVTNPDTVEKEDIILGRLYEIDAEGNPIEDGQERPIVLNPMRIKEETCFEPFIGKSVDEYVPFQVSSISDDNAVIAEVMFISEEEVKEMKDKQFSFKIMRINRTIASEMNEAFFTKLNDRESLWEEGETEEITEEFVKEKLKEKLVDRFKEAGNWYFQEKIQRGLLEKHAISLPDEFLREWLYVANQDKYTQHQIDHQYDEYANSVKWSLISEQMEAKHPELSIKEEELDEQIIEFLKEHTKASMGLEDMLQNAKQNQEIVNMARRRLADKKLTEFLHGQYSPENKAISATEFVALNEEENKA